MSNNAHELSNRLLNALDNNYNVVDMHAVNEIISILERFNITKELLETTRLGKHVNELRRKTTEPTLARRAKVLVKRWRDLVIPTTTSPGHTGSNRSSAERQVRRLAGTPLTSPALSRQVVSPAVPSPRTASRPAWGGYESDSQDVILVDDDPPPGPIAPLPPLPPALTPSVKRPLSPQPLHDEKKAKRDKKPKKRRGHGRAGGTEAGGGVAAPGGLAGAGGGSAGGGPAGGGPAAGGPWGARNGAAHAERRNGCRRDALEPYAALVNKLPPLGAKKVKTTQELLAQIQSRGSRPPPARAPSPSPPASPASPASPDVMLIEPDPSPVAGSSPLRNGACSPAREAEAAAEAGAEAEAEADVEEEVEEEEVEACTCGAEALAACPAARRREVRALHVRALHHCLVAGLNGTRAPPRPPPPAARPARPALPGGLFASVVPLYRYCDYSDDYCVKNMSQVPLCPDLPWLIPDPPAEKAEPPAEKAEPSEAPAEGETEPLEAAAEVKAEIPEAPAEGAQGPPSAPAEAELKPPSPPSAPPPPALAEGGRGLVQLCAQCSSNVPYTYRMMAPAPVMAMPRDEEQLARALAEAAEAAEAEERPPRPARFAEWHEAACLPRGLTALPYVVLD